MKTLPAVITYKIPLLGEKRVTHVDVKVTDFSVAPLLTAKSLLRKHIFHLKNKAKATFIGFQPCRLTLLCLNTTFQSTNTVLTVQQSTVGR